METKRIVSVFSRAMHQKVVVYHALGGTSTTGVLVHYTIDGLAIETEDKITVLIPKTSIKLVRMDTKDDK